jgi:hypothetical protein
MLLSTVAPSFLFCETTTDVAHNDFSVLIIGGERYLFHPSPLAIVHKGVPNHSHLAGDDLAVLDSGGAGACNLSGVFV